MDEWMAIADVNRVYCDLNQMNDFYNKKNSRVSKITISRAYCNLIRYYHDKAKCREILKKSIANISIFESINLHAENYITQSHSILEKKIENLRNDENGKIFISFHFGAFELIPLVLAIYLKQTIYVIIDAITPIRQSRIKYYRYLLNHKYPHADIKFILVQDILSIRKLIKILRNRGIIFIYFDENKSLKNNNQKIVTIPFIAGYNYLVRTSIPYFLKKTDSSVYSVISTIIGNKIYFKIEFITNNFNQDYNNLFYANALNLLKQGLSEHPCQWTRWYNVDELDDSALIQTKKRNHRFSELKITDHYSLKKYILDINHMKIKEVRRDTTENIK